MRAFLMFVAVAIAAFLGSFLGSDREGTLHALLGTGAEAVAKPEAPAEDQGTDELSVAPVGPRGLSREPSDAARALYAEVLDAKVTLANGEADGRLSASAFKVLMTEGLEANPIGNQEARCVVRSFTLEYIGRGNNSARSINQGSSPAGQALVLLNQIRPGDRVAIDDVSVSCTGWESSRPGNPLYFRIS